MIIFIKGKGPTDLDWDEENPSYYLFNAPMYYRDESLNQKILSLDLSKQLEELKLKLED